MKKELSIKEVADWLREKATELNNTASSLEQLMGPGEIVSRLAPDPHTDSASWLTDPEINVNDVANVLRQKGAARAKSIANELHVSKFKILKIIRANSRFFQEGAKGWIKLSEGMV